MIVLTGLVPTAVSAVGAGLDSGVPNTVEAAAPIEPTIPVEFATVPVQAAPEPFEPLRMATEYVPPPPPPEPVVVAPAPAPVAVETPTWRHPVAAAGPGATVPEVAVAAYSNAADILAKDSPGCHLPWTLLGGIGRVESDHAYGGSVDENGTTLRPIHGPSLDGSTAGNAVITDTDDGALDGIADYDRAVGPMQFIPGTWRAYAADGNGDGSADPDNLFDAALTAGRYLCAGGLDLDDPDQRTKAILRYNNSMAYVTNVLAWEAAYRTGGAPSWSELPPI
ncbi:lytic transglycosylase domain-containing protein [Nocardia takedensis]